MKKRTFLIGALLLFLGAIFVPASKASAVGDWVPLEKNSLYSSNTDTFFDNNNVVYEVFNDLTRGNCQSLARYSSDSWEYIPGPQASLCGSYLFYFDGENIPHLIQKIGGYSGVSGEIVISRYVNGAWE